MLALLRTTLFLGALTCALTDAMSQRDTTSIGGTNDASAYGEPIMAGPEASAFDMMGWDVNDSLRHLPCYDLYCGWNTDAIFSQRDHRQGSSPMLQLTTSACDHAMPVCGELNSDFGVRRGRMHYGLDIDLETGDPVVAAFEGVVRIARYHGAFGNVVVIRHWNGLETLYGHLSKCRVQPGQLVMAGDTIGLGGSTGRSTGSHLHFETRYLGRPIDPKFIFDLESGDLKNTSLQVNNGLFEAVSGARSFHIVRRGDSLSTIGRRYGVTVTQLCRMNRISARGTLRIGQRVRYR